MKKYLIALFSLLLSSCITDEVVTTTFHPDGSLTRVVEFRSSKKNFDPSELCTPVDSTWQITVTKDTVGNRDDDFPYRVRAERHYSDIAGLNDDYRKNGTLLSGIKREVSFEKKFMWFYTFYYYQETVYGVFKKGRPEKYLTDEEYRFLKGDPVLKEKMATWDSAAVDSLSSLAYGKFLQWVGDRMFDILFAGMKEVVSDHPSGAFTPARLLAARDTLLELYKKAYTPDLTGDKVFRQYFLKELGQDPDTLIAQYPAVFERYDRLMDHLLEVIYYGDYQNRIMLPGKVFDANGVVEEKGRVFWQVRPVVYLAQDQDMFAASRVANLWAWLVAAMITLFAVVLWLPKKK